MNYIKNNKIFIFLFSCLFCIIAALSYRLLIPEQSSNLPQSNTNQSTTTKINSFNGYFSDEKLAVELSWNISTGNKKISSILLYCNDEQIEDVTNSYSVALPENSYNIGTGNNKFDLVVTFSDDSELRKSTYVYTDEAFAINITEQNMDTKSSYIISYFYDKRKPVNVPSVQMNGGNANFTINYINSEIVSETGNIVNMRVIYDLNYNNAKPGNYQVNLTFSFSQYNLSKSYNSSFQVVSSTVNNGENTNNDPSNGNSEPSEGGESTGDSEPTEGEGDNSGDVGNE